MAKYIAKRLLQILLVVFLYASIVYFIFYLGPADPTARFIGNPDIPPEARQKLAEQFGLNKPPHLQWLNYMRNMFIEFDLGRSLSSYPRPVWDFIITRWPRTIVLFVSAILISYYLGFSLGKFIAWRRGQLSDYLATITGVSLWTVFTPWWALLLIWFFSFRLGIFPINQFLTPELWSGTGVDSQSIFIYMILSGFLASLFLFLVYFLSKRLIVNRKLVRIVNYSAAGVTLIGVIVGWLVSGYGTFVGDILWHMGVPIITLATIQFGGSMLLMRDSMLETIKEDYITTARAKGISDKQVRDKHAARTALLPLVTSFILAIPTALDGAMVIEIVFSWPGIGLTFLRAINTGDYPLAVGSYTFFGLIAITAHLVADIIYSFLDPRISYEEGAMKSG